MENNTPTPWSEMSFWQRWTDKDPSRPEKTWKSRLFWTFPITTIKGGWIKADSPRIEYKRFGTLMNEKGSPALYVKTTRYKGTDTYQGIKLSNYRIFAWHGWFWGWQK